MHEDYRAGKIHRESPVPGGWTVAGVIMDAEALLEASYGERWPSRAAVQLGTGAVLRCTNHREQGQSAGPETLLDVSLDRSELHSAAGSHVLFRAWLHREPLARVVHGSVERVNALTWMVEEFSCGDWVAVLRRMADEAKPPVRVPGDHW